MGWNGSISSAWAAFALALAGALGGLVMFLWRGRKSIGGALSMLTRPFTINGKLDAILAELGTNGGASLRDAINRVEIEQARAGVEQGRTMSLVMSLMNSEKRPMFEADAVGDYVDVNVAYLAATGRQRFEVTGKGWINVVHGADRADVWGKWNAAVAQKRAFEEEYRITDLDGVTKRWVCYAYPSLGRGGDVTGWVGHCEYLWREDDPEGGT